MAILNKKTTVIVILLLLVAMGPNRLAVAQFTTARLAGTVTDKGGAAIPGASVTVQQVSTGYTQSVRTGANGDYLFPTLPVGNYSLNVKMDGFSTYVQGGITLTVGQAATQNVALQVGAVAQHFGLVETGGYTVVPAVFKEHQGGGSDCRGTHVSASIGPGCCESLSVCCLGHA